MAVRSVAYFKGLFKTGYKITETNYQDWLDSFRHASASVPLSDTTGLDALLAAYRKNVDSVPVDEVSGLGTYISGLLADYLTSSSAIAQSQVTGLVDALAGAATVEKVGELIDAALVGIAQDAPSIGGNGNWWVNGVDTGVRASGVDGVDGVSPLIGGNGNWWVDGVDSGVKAAGGSAGRIDYDANIMGVRDGVNKLFSAALRFRVESLKVYRSGMRLSPGYDYNTLDDFQTVSFHDAVVYGDLLIFEYDIR